MPRKLRMSTRRQLERSKLRRKKLLEQVKIAADCNKKEATVTQIGRNASGVNGMALTKDSSIVVRPGDLVELLVGQFPHEIVFNDENSEQGNKTSTSASSPIPVNKISSSEDEEEASSEEEARRKAYDDDNNDDGDGDVGDLNEPPAKKAKVLVPINITSDYWETVEDGKLLVYTHPESSPSSLIASYDLDGTIIGTQSGGVFPKSSSDWKILHPEVPVKLKEMHDKNYKIIFFTNQAGLSTGKTNVNEFKNKIEDIVRSVNVPVQVFIATGYNFYRKPAIGMWDAARLRNAGIEIDKSKSFYCGDAAGRVGTSKRKKDFSSCDILFAKNLDLHFETPEHHFLNLDMQPFRISVFDPKAIPCDIPLCTPSCGQIISYKQEVIILVGFPGAGKTHFAKTHLVPAGYTHISRDNLGSWNKCVKAMIAALEDGQKVVVDNTNPDPESRKRYVDAAKNLEIPVRCFILSTNLFHAKHNNKFRQLTDPSHMIVSDVVMNTFNKKYTEPTLDEGFSEILRINFWPTFKDPAQERLYKLFLLEK